MLALAALAVSGVVSGCSATSGSESKGRTVTVFAAASLTVAFRDLGHEYERAHPGQRVRLNFAGSPVLVEQIRNGAPADLFASADQSNMTKAAKAGLVAGDAEVFATNSLSIVVEHGNPRHITGLADLDRGGLSVSLCGPAVPAGRYALQAFAKAGVAPPKASHETDVKQVVSRVSLGQADAGVVYVTDVRAAGNRVSGVPIPAAGNVTARYPAAVLKDARNPADAHAFLAFLTSSAGRAVLARYGFGAP